MRFKHIHKNLIYICQCWLFHFDYSNHISDGFHLMNPALIIIGNVLTHLTIRSPIMTDVVWCTPTSGITYPISHHDGCHLVHPDMWYHLNAIRHHDECRLVHPAKWDISSMPYAIMTDADLCIPLSGTLENFGLPS